MQAEKMIMDALKKTIRIGVVHSYDAGTRMARVKFESLGGIVSAPIKVVSRPRHVVTGQKETSGDKVAYTQLKYDQNDTLVTESHTHQAYITDWDPKINDQVLCIYFPDGGGDGYVIGEV